jgi:hypothetical protein
MMSRRRRSAAKHQERGAADLKRTGSSCSAAPKEAAASQPGTLKDLNRF